MRAFWIPILLLIRLRWKLRRRALARSSATQLGVALALIVFVPAANAAGIACYHQLRALPAAQAEGVLRTYLFGVQGAWLAMLLLAGGGRAAASLAARRATGEPLRFLPVRSGQAVGAAMLGALTDLPLLLALPFFVAAARAFGAGRPAATVSCAGVSLAAFALQTAASAALLEQVAAVLRGWRLPAALALGGMAAWAAMPLLPPAVAARAVGASGRGEWAAAALGMALLSTRRPPGSGARRGCGIGAPGRTRARAARGKAARRGVWRRGGTRRRHPTRRRIPPWPWRLSSRGRSGGR